jgi:uncharacterized membrane protein YdbT with pleckstrin-like domain
MVEQNQGQTPESERKTFHLSQKKFYFRAVQNTFFILILILLIVGANNLQSFFPSIQINAGINIAVLIVTIVLILVIIFLVISTIYYYFYRRSYLIELTPSDISFSFGVLSKRFEGIEMHSVKDCNYKRSISEMMLGTADVHIFADDYTTPHVNFDDLDMVDAKAIFDYISKYSSESVVKYFRTHGPEDASDPERAQQIMGIINHEKPKE